MTTETATIPILREQDGTWIQTYTGRRFWPLDPRPNEVTIGDIAHALSMICRYNGHTRRFYSVAEHSILLCRYILDHWPAYKIEQLQALMHDAAEAYLCDIPRPVKPMLPGYREAEHRVEVAIQTAFGLPFPGHSKMTKTIDQRILYDEANALMGVDSIAWHQRFAPGLDVEIRCLSPEQAEAEFLEEFHRLTARKSDDPS